MTKQNIAYLIAGIVTGTAAGVFGTRTYFKKKYEKISDEEINDMEAYYRKKYASDLQYLSLEEEEDIQKEASSINTRETGPLSAEERAEIREKLQRNYEETTNYAAIYKNKKEENKVSEAEVATENHHKNKHQEPRIISEDDLGDVPAYFENETLFYYSGNDVLTDEDDVVISDPEELIGDALDKYHFRESNEKIIFVKNSELDTVYEIQKIDEDFEEYTTEEE